MFFPVHVCMYIHIYMYIYTYMYIYDRTVVGKTEAIGGEYLIQRMNSLLIPLVREVQLRSWMFLVRIGVLAV